MRKNNWIVTAIAAVACGVLLWAWFALGFNHVDDPLDLVVARRMVARRGRRGGRHRVGRGQEAREDAPGLRRRGRRVQPEAGLVMPDARRERAGSAGADALGHGVPRRGGRAGRARAPPPSAGWCGAASSTATAEVWEGEVVAAHDPGRPGRAVRVPRGPGRPPGGVGATRRPFGAET